MAEIVQRAKRSDINVVREKKFKPFKTTILFSSKEDALQFSNTIAGIAPQVADAINQKAYR